MAEAADFKLEELPGDVGDHVIELVELWHAAHQENPDEILPTRDVLSAERLRPWVDDISIYEYQSLKDDFLILIHAASAVRLYRESFQRASPREIDMKYGSCLSAALFDTMMRGNPTFHYVSFDMYPDQHWIRVLLPVRTRDQDGNTIDQIFGVLFEYEYQYQI
ncbi:hypothetical protein [Thalassospira sp. MCCC 1A03138]|uniref:hypothetical protein n=1 Tax=Thalassospira sp. MCCC 1A03138 TaxID=1470576 RepID=UPI000A1FE5EC|nr:hypothetical protein [Thalassospira sp. MCCC 1A03138]OSQ31182.1 hypothetical protein TH468_09560 [Thalassospira sp. MCCC 1A03138]